MPDLLDPVVLLWGLVLAALGAVLRLLADTWLPHRGVLLVNVVGSFLAGAAQAWATLAVPGAEIGPADALASPTPLSGFLLPFITALTTFSTVSVRTATLVLGGRSGAAVRSWAAHLLGGLAAAVLGVLVVAGVVSAGF